MAEQENTPLAVLIVEDEAVNAKLLRGIVGKLGHAEQVRIATSLDDAAQALKQRHFDVILLDLNLPDSQGLETVLAVTGLAPTSAVIVITGEYDEQVGLQALRHGVQDYLVKGKYDLYTLDKSIRYAIERKRTELAQKQLLKDLEGVNEELRSFAYIVSHDLKAPLRGIRSLAEWIAEDYADKLGDEGKEQIALLLSRVERMHDLIDGVLQYSRVGRICEDRVEVDLNKLLAEAVELVAPPEHIAIEVAAGLPTIHGEPTRLLQVFENLLSNAVKYMDKPEGRVWVTCEEDGDFWRLGVHDNGPGIDAKHFEKIFQIFQTVHGRDDCDSTGVGLSLVKKIVEMYGGRVWVESEVGRGSTFYVTFPKHRPTEDNGTPADETADEKPTDDEATAGATATDQAPGKTASCPPG